MCTWEPLVYPLVYCDGDQSNFEPSHDRLYPRIGLLRWETYPAPIPYYLQNNGGGVSQNDFNLCHNTHSASYGQDYDFHIFGSIYLRYFRQSLSVKGSQKIYGGLRIRTKD